MHRAGVHVEQFVSKSADSIIWMVDDAQSVRDSMRAFLEALGRMVRDFPSAREFLDAFDPTQPGVLVVDFHMPEMNGLELLRHLRAEGHDLPVIVITGRGDAALAERVLDAGAMAMLYKPVDGNELAALLEPTAASAG
jgi:two-component system response regulator FixJ